MPKPSAEKITSLADLLKKHSGTPIKCPTKKHEVFVTKHQSSEFKSDFFELVEKGPDGFIPIVKKIIGSDRMNLSALDWKKT